MPAGVGGYEGLLWGNFMKYRLRGMGMTGGERPNKEKK